MNRIGILKGLDADLIELLKPIFEKFSCSPGTVIFQQGDPAEFLYLLTDGKVDISFKPRDGSPITIAHVGKGRLFGWSAVVGSYRYTSSAIVIERIEAFRIHGTELCKFCRDHPEAGKQILERLADAVSFPWKDAYKQVQSILYRGMAEKLRFV